MSQEASSMMQWSSYCHLQHKYGSDTTKFLSIYFSSNEAEVKAKAEAEGPRPLLPKGLRLHSKCFLMHISSIDFTSFAGSQ